MLIEKYNQIGTENFAVLKAWHGKGPTREKRRQFLGAPKYHLKDERLNKVYSDV